MNVPMGASEIIPDFAASLLEYFEKQLEPFLTGEYAFPDLALEQETAGAPLTNSACEASFGFLDHLTKVPPNMTTYNMSIKTVAVKNKLYDYFSSLPEMEREEMERKACENMKTSVEQAMIQKKELQQKLFRKMEEKARELAEEQSRNQRKKHKVASEVEKCGFWRTVEAMNQKLENATPKNAKSWIKSNIQFRKKVWQPSFEPKWLLQFSHKNHTFSLEELKNNLVQLIAADPEWDISEEEDCDD
uniref:RWD domain-containing protein n=1 Tax=Panagrolaimus sp. JU765 TaxID=591449 RepID=A0AC34QCQ7_9BILA